MPPSIIASTGDFRGKDRPAIGQTWPTVSHGIGKKQVQTLEHADQRRGARELVLAERAGPGPGLHPVPRTGRYAEQRRTFGIVAAPGPDKP
jgi:hypothetical protein